MQQINKPYDGLFITIEGGEGCGKTSLATSLTAELEKRGYSVLKTREPGGTSLSECIRKILLTNEECNMSEKAELLLFLAARAQHVEEAIKPALHQGKIVLCERFNDSTVAYQGCARGLGLDFVKNLCEFVIEGPDFTLLLDIDPTEGLRRMKEKGKQPDRIEKEDLQFHWEVRRGYLELADHYPQRIAVLDAAGSLDEVFEAAIKALEPHLMIRKP